MQQDWLDMVANEGTARIQVGPAGDVPDGELPCPACGTAAPLVDGECSDCGLYLG